MGTLACISVSNKVIFVLLGGLCIMGIFIIASHKMAASISYETSNYTHIESPQTKPPPTTDIFFPLAVEQPSAVNSTSEKLRLKSTTVTFNDTLVVYCKESPYVVCSLPSMGDGSRERNSTKKHFKISLLRRPHWIGKNFNMASCPFNQCTLVENSITKQTDLVIVYGVGLTKKYKLPKRWQGQQYALAVWESPYHTNSGFITDQNDVWNHQFNLTITYRVDSDIFVPYNFLRFSPNPPHERPNYYEIAKNKTKTAVWIVSHCKTHSKREQYVQEMKKYVDIDILGSCGKPCSVDNSACSSFQSIYKFYLSFESAMCTDYVTEKFFKLFTPGIHVVPVVRGGADYDKYFPSSTFINAAHFKTPKDLALHLKNLAGDLDTYSKYLEHKDLYVTCRQIDYICTTCEYLHTREEIKSETYNLKSWFGDGHCSVPSV